MNIFCLNSDKKRGYSGYTWLHLNNNLKFRKIQNKILIKARLHLATFGYKITVWLHYTTLFTFFTTLYYLYNSQNQSFKPMYTGVANVATVMYV